MSFGGGSEKSSSSSRQFIAPFQQQALQRLFNDAEGVFNQTQPGLQERSQQVGNRTFSQGARNLNQITGIAEGSNPFIQNLLARSQGENPFLQGQVDALGRDIGRFATEQLQDVGQGFVSAGQFGGSRQGLAEGQTIGRALDEFSQGAGALRSQDLERQTQAATQAANLQLGAGQAGLAGAEQLFNLGLSPFLGQFAGLNALSGILGDPTVLTQTQSKGKGSNFSIGLE